MYDIFYGPIVPEINYSIKFYLHHLHVHFLTWNGSIRKYMHMFLYLYIRVNICEYVSG